MAAAMAELYSTEAAVSAASRRRSSEDGSSRRRWPGSTGTPRSSRSVRGPARSSGWCWPARPRPPGLQRQVSRPDGRRHRHRPSRWRRGPCATAALAHGAVTEAGAVGRRVHEAERGVRGGAGGRAVERGIEVGQHVDPLLDVLALQLADPAAVGAGGAWASSEVDRDERRAAQRERCGTAGVHRGRPAGSAAWAAARPTPSSSCSLIATRISPSSSSLPLKWWCRAGPRRRRQHRGHRPWRDGTAPLGEQFGRRRPGALPTITPPDECTSGSGASTGRPNDKSCTPPG